MFSGWKSCLVTCLGKLFSGQDGGIYIQYINIYIHAHTQKACINIVRIHKWTEGAHRGYWLCFSLTTSLTPRSSYSVQTKGPFSFPALFLFSHIFPLSHTFVDVLCCLGQMYVRDQWNISSFLLSTAGNFAGRGGCRFFLCHSTAGLFSVFGVC